jgi:hypothetical protein
VFPFWQFFKPNNVSEDVVAEVCSTTAGGNGYTAQAPQFQAWILPNASITPLSSATPVNVTSGGVAQVLFTWAAPPAAAAIVSLTSSNPSVFPVPQYVAVSEGVPSFGFDVTAGPVASLTLVLVTASYYGVTSTATVIVAPQQ